MSAQAAPIDDKQAQAAELEQQIYENGHRIDALNEQVNSAQIALDEANDTIALATTQVRAATAKTHQLRSELAKRAAVLYRRSGTTGGVADLDAHNANELSTRRKYTALAAQREKQLVTRLNSAKEELRTRRLAAQAARAEAQQQKQQIESAKADRLAEANKQQDLLSHVKGDIAVLVKQQQDEREARERAEALARVPATPVVTAEQAQSDANANANATFSAASEPTATTAAPTATTAAPTATTAAPAATSSGGGSGDGSGSGSGSGGGTSAASGSSAPAPSGGASAAIAYAYAQLGKPYCYAGVGPDCYDCSGLTMMAWAQAGVSMPHGSTEQYYMFPHVPLSEAQPGDLIVWDGHVGLYIGGGQVIHAPHTGTVVQISSIWDTPWGAARPG